MAGSSPSGVVSATSRSPAAVSCSTAPATAGLGSSNRLAAASTNRPRGMYVWPCSAKVSSVYCRPAARRSAPSRGRPALAAMRSAVFKPIPLMPSGSNAFAFPILVPLRPVRRVLDPVARHPPLVADVKVAKVGADRDQLWQRVGFDEGGLLGTGAGIGVGHRGCRGVEAHRTVGREAQHGVGGLWVAKH